MQDQTVEMLRSGNRRIGKARRQVVDVLAAQPGPITADGVIDLLPGVSASSVYRSLNVLEELGYVRHVHLAHGAALYELTDRLASVRHLVCEVCGNTIQIPAALLAPLSRRIERDLASCSIADTLPFPVDAHRVRGPNLNRTDQALRVRVSPIAKCLRSTVLSSPTLGRS